MKVKKGLNKAPDKLISARFKLHGEKKGTELTLRLIEMN
jgi:hypothetical protein